MKNQDFTIIKKEHQSNLDLQADYDIFDLEPHALRRLIASKIRVGKKNAQSIKNIHSELAVTVKNITNYSDEDQKEYRKYQDRTTNKVKFAVRNMYKLYPQKLKMVRRDDVAEDNNDDDREIDWNAPSEETKVSTKDAFYWEDADSKNIALNNETTHGMPLARAMAYKLVKENLKNLIPPSEIESLAPYFDAAEKSINKFSKNESASIVAEYRPFSTTFFPKPITPENHEKIFTAIETKRVLKAKYQSIHGGIPEEIIFSPQQIRVQFMQTQVVGFAHNTTSDSSNEDRKGSTVINDGVYRHLTINRFSDIQFCNEAYKIELQPMKDFEFVSFSHPWVTNNLENLMLSEDQVITDWHAMSNEDRELITNLRDKEPEKWAKVTATIQLPEAFLDHHDEWDAWFFVNAISMYGADMIVIEPSQVVGEIKRRLVSNNHAYMKDT
jgi:hypothetical protein